MNENERKQIERNFYIIGLCLPGVVVLLLVVWNLLPQVLKMPCVLYATTGLYCPGCGGTRAVAALLHGRFLLSFLYHPIVLYGAVIYLWFMISHAIERASKHRLCIGMHYRNLYLWIALALVVINIAVKDIALTAFGIDFLKILGTL